MMLTVGTVVVAVGQANHARSGGVRGVQYGTSQVSTYASRPRHTVLRRTLQKRA